MALKHVGRIKGNRRKVIVAFRVVPGEPDNCLVIQTENLSADEHDALMKVIESPAGQDAYESAEAMMRAYLPDGRNMLQGFDITGKIRKFPTNEIEMTPDSNTTIGLDELNNMIAEQRGLPVSELALKGPDGQTVEPVEPITETTETTDVVDAYATSDTPVEPADDGLLTDEKLAAQYRSQADALFKEAKKLREQAEELVPTKRKAKTKESA